MCKNNNVIYVVFMVGLLLLLPQACHPTKSQGNFSRKERRGPNGMRSPSGGGGSAASFSTTEPHSPNEFPVPPKRRIFQQHSETHGVNRQFGFSNAMKPVSLVRSVIHDDKWRWCWDFVLMAVIFWAWVQVCLVLLVCTCRAWHEQASVFIFPLRLPHPCAIGIGAFGHNGPSLECPLLGQARPTTGVCVVYHCFRNRPLRRFSGLRC